MSNRTKGNISRHTVSFTVTAGTYSVGDVIQGLKTIEKVAIVGIGAGKIVNVVASDRAQNVADLDVHFFGNELDGTYTDQATFDPSDNDIQEYFGCMELRKHHSFVDNSVSVPDINQRDIPFELGVNADGKQETSLRLVVQDKAGVTFAAPTDFQLDIYVQHPDGP